MNSNLHGTYMEPSWNLHETYMESADEWVNHVEIM